ncbi:DUF485 domain-containing protein [Rhizomonospora bruguierae]|uniref:hypothetical protein n=1 Tax=Rhizomonospora bruguierae TaxID=1581705 RepID=UPI001BCDE8B0|nr:hypothetical protein [Micromonospora sp. NBRC 107566]
MATKRAQPPTRTRVVLGELRQRRSAGERLAGDRVELSEPSGVGDALVRGLVRAQLVLALRLTLVVAVGLGGLPLLFVVAPAAGTARVFGVNVPWLLLGLVAYPFLVAVGWAYVHLAERNEQQFTAVVRRPER